VQAAADRVRLDGGRSVAGVAAVAHAAVSVCCDRRVGGCGDGLAGVVAGLQALALVGVDADQKAR